MSEQVQPVDPLIRLTGPIVPGYGRGSKELGVPTANIQHPDLQNLPLQNGVYFGWAKLSDLPGSTDKEPVRMMCCSYGNNPYYHNTLNTLEIHIMHQYDCDLYDRQLKVIICGFIRPQTDFDSLDKLIERIQMDLQISKANLINAKQWKSLHEDEFFRD
jgi:riboflavin kinase